LSQGATSPLGDSGAQYQGFQNNNKASSMSFSTFNGGSVSGGTTAVLARQPRTYRLVSLSRYSKFR
jgi:hypothetical protein